MKRSRQEVLAMECVDFRMDFAFNVFTSRGICALAATSSPSAAACVFGAGPGVFGGGVAGTSTSAMDMTCSMTPPGSWCLPNAATRPDKRARSRNVPIDALSHLMSSAASKHNRDRFFEKQSSSLLTNLVKCGVCRRVASKQPEMLSQCAHCDQRMLGCCTCECVGCQQIFCSFCSTTNCDLAYDRSFCLSCNSSR